MSATLLFPVGAVFVSFFAAIFPEILIPFKNAIVPLLGVVMLGMGMLMLLVSWWAALQFLRGKTIDKPLLLVLSAMTFSGWVATLAGWYVTEIGRQPWIVYGQLRTADVVADHASATLSGTLFGYIGLYVFLLISYIQALRYLASKPAQSLSLLPTTQPIVLQGNRTDG